LSLHEGKHVSGVSGAGRTWKLDFETAGKSPRAICLIKFAGQKVPKVEADQK